MLSTEMIPPRRRDGALRYGGVVASVGRSLGAYSLPNAQRTMLKRYGSYCEADATRVALRLLIEAGAPAAAMGNREVRAWLWLIHCMALLSGPNRDPHSLSNEARPGHVLQRAGYSEFSLGRLLDSRGETFNLLLERAVRRIARTREAVNWTKIAPLLLSPDPESAWAENARLVITRDYVRAAYDGAVAENGAAIRVAPAPHSESFDD
jgi:hypothetical protein